MTKVYVVVYLQSYDGPIFDSVFRTREKAEEYIASLGRLNKDIYGIEECELD